MHLKPGPTQRTLVTDALNDLDDARQILGSRNAADKPHVLRAADVCISVAELRLQAVFAALEGDET